jgi:hypothetical protein
MVHFDLIRFDDPASAFSFSDGNFHCIGGKQRPYQFRPFNKTIVVAEKILFIAQIKKFVNTFDPIEIEMVNLA